MKKIIIIFLVFFFCGCSKTERIESIIEKENRYVIAIQYPVTKYSKVNKKIKNTINYYYSSFKKEVQVYSHQFSELNIDYTYDKLPDNLIQVSFTIYQDVEGNVTTEEKFFAFDLKKQKFIFLEKISPEEKVMETLELKNRIIDYNKPVIALTFDDGPSQYTENILNTLKKYKVNATFFVIGNKVKNYQSVLLRCLYDGNEIGNHTYNHKYLPKLNEQDFLLQIEKTQEVIKKYTGYTPTIMRPSYGAVNKKMKSLTNLEIVLWNIDTLDWRYHNVQKIADKVLEKASDGAIVLMHDTYQKTSEALNIIIPKLLESGYQLVTISELNEVKQLRRITR